ncbi:hypothetical protein MPUL_00830 [Mycolicibacterium pulveris]|uniref:Transcriptional regulator WhiB n=1 Tax=Mycolicibacterium pulveris TaxID=36813 RepID=A0A7I7UCE6_MYCPV|nr:WhiB family transcriptional regulator [Mycolicibacterium pulveris]BBY78925.1 hypothetical protein MPUL_00830 [Mycolicibacterium pulveris]
MNVDEDWPRRAVCRGMDPELFFPGEKDTPAQRAAIAICQRCPVREPCLASAKRSGVTYGVFGGVFINHVMTGRPGRPEAPCGTSGARMRHRNRGETCRTCGIDQTARR